MTSKTSSLSWLGFGLAGLIILALIGAGGGYWWFQGRYHPAGPSFSFPAPKDEAEGRLQDLDALKRLPDYDHSFTADTKTAFLDKIESIRGDAATMSPVRFALEISEAVAQADNVHTRVVLAGRFNRLPVRIARFREGFYVTKATAENADLLGDQVLAIGGVAIDEALGRFTNFGSGSDERRRYDAMSLLHSPEVLQALGLAAESESAELFLLQPDGKTVERLLAALPPLGETQADFRPWMDVIPTLQPGPDSENWQSYMPAGGVSESWLADPHEPVGTDVLTRPNALYIRLRQGTDPQKFRTMLAASLKTADAKPVHHVIVDLRSDAGKDATATEDFVRDLPKAAPDGAIFVLTGAGTRNAAIPLLAGIKASVPDRVMIIGEPSGDPAQFWGETGGPFVLPNSKLTVDYATGFHDWEHGCSEFPKCYRPRFRSDIAAGPLKPDVMASQRFADYMAGRDTLIEVIRLLVGNPES